MKENRMMGLSERLQPDGGERIQDLRDADPSPDSTAAENGLHFSVFLFLIDL